MQVSKSKSMVILIALILTISMSASIILVPTTSAHSPPWTIISYAYVAVQPNPVGLGQKVEVAMWVDAPMVGAALGNPCRRSGYALTITAPDGTNTTETWASVNDPTGIQSYLWTPTQVGTYQFTFNYAGQTYTWTAAQGGNVAYDGDVFTPASATTNLTVQQTQLPTPIDSYPLPTAYWTYPIEGQNSYWYTIASNWLGQPYILNAGDAYNGGQQPYGSAPESAHIMWTSPDGYGGVVGGNDTNVPGEQYYTGLSYNPRFNNPIIMQGVLYYQQSYGNSGTGGPYVAINLMTGQQLWSINTTATGISLVPSFGYEYSYDGPNQHGVLPNGLLIAPYHVGGIMTPYGSMGGITCWAAYDPSDGVLTSMNITNVPSGSAVAGPAGEYLIYTLTNYGTPSNPNYYLAQWNSSDVFGMITGANLSPTGWYSGTENASLPSAYDWNVSVSLGGSPTGWAIGTCERGTQPMISLGDVAIMIQGTFGGHVSDMGATTTTYPANITAISLNPTTLGKTLWTQLYPQEPNNETRFLSAWDPANGIFIFSDKEDFANYGYSLSTGKLVWGPSYPASSPSEAWDFPIWYTQTCYNGNLYADGFSGLLTCWNDTTGTLEWTFGNGGTGNSTFAGLYTPYGYYPMFAEAIANGIIYIAGNDHSPNSPMYKNSQLIAVNATNGAELWSILGWGNQMSGAEGAVASGYLTVYDPYDSQVYCYGQGPSQLTVSAPQTSIELGSSLVIRGTVTDISAGTKQAEQAADFPNGVPAVSDASMSSFMETVYMQKPMPTNVTGVPVSLYVLDSNGNYRQIGTATSDASGMFTYTWTPDIPGSYTVYASFAGSNSYYPSSAESSFTVSAVTSTSPTPASIVSLPPMEMYIAAAAIAIILAIAIVGAIIVTLLKKRP